MMKTYKRFLSVLLALVMVFSMVTATVIQTGAAESTSTVEVVFELTGVRGVQGTFDYDGDASVEVVSLTGPKNAKVSAENKTYWITFDYDTTATFVLTLAVSGEVGAKTTVVFDYFSTSSSGDVEDTYTVDLEVVDYTALNAAIARAYAVEGDKYVNMDDVYAALAVAESLVNASGSQAEVDAATDALNAAIDALVLYFPIDYSDLKAAIADAESRNPYSYTVESYEKMAVALAAAKAILNTATVQSEVDRICAELRNAITRLIPESTDVDYTRLTAAVEAAEALDVEVYTADTWANLVAALTPAKDMLENKTALSQRHADDVAAALEAATAALVKTPLELTNLYQLIAEAEALDYYRYTTESWDALAAALKAAKELAPEKQSQVDAAAEALSAALAGLVELPPVDYSALQSAIDEAKAIEQGEYTDKSWNALQAAIVAAEALLPDKALVQGQVDAALAALNAAKDGLTVPEITVETEIVTEIVTEIETVVVTEVVTEIETVIVTEVETRIEYETVIEEVTVPVEPTDDYCNIGSHKIWPVLFGIFLALTIALVILIVVYLILKKKKESDDTPVVDYDIEDDAGEGTEEAAEGEAFEDDEPKTDAE
ncbi:MAG: FIVAR domain-containing protein [Clostridia bacterium]|nr:FIVAR domain-containing protein [Clostridia bacterium]